MTELESIEGVCQEVDGSMVVGAYIKFDEVVEFEDSTTNLFFLSYSGSEWFELRGIGKNYKGDLVARPVGLFGSFMSFFESIASIVKYIERYGRMPELPGGERASHWPPELNR